MTSDVQKQRDCLEALVVGCERTASAYASHQLAIDREDVVYACGRPQGVLRCTPDEALNDRVNKALTHAGIYRQLRRAD